MDLKPFPLWAFLILYEKTYSNCLPFRFYCSISALVNWLGPIDTSELDKLTIRKLTKLEESYELYELARALNVDKSKLFQYYNEVNNYEHPYSYTDRPKAEVAKSQFQNASSIMP